jgi:hypothetical protein
VYCRETLSAVFLLMGLIILPTEKFKLYFHADPVEILAAHEPAFFPYPYFL